MPDDRRSDKGLPTRSERVSPGPLSRKPFGFLFSSLGRDGHEAIRVKGRVEVGYPRIRSTKQTIVVVTIFTVGQIPNHFRIEILKEIEKDMDLAHPMREGAIKYSLFLNA